MTPSRLDNPFGEQLRQQVANAVGSMPISVDDPDKWSARLVLGSVAAVKYGLDTPWYQAKHEQIARSEGGVHALVEIVAGIAMGLIADDPTLSVSEATFQAGCEWRASIRPQYDARYAPQVPLESVSEHSLVTYQPHDQPQSKQSREAEILGEAWDTLTSKQQRVLELWDGGAGLTYAEIAVELGMKGGKQAVWKLAQRGKDRLRDAIERELNDH